MSAGKPCSFLLFLSFNTCRRQHTHEVSVWISGYPSCHSPVLSDSSPLAWDSLDHACDADQPRSCWVWICIYSFYLVQQYQSFVVRPICTFIFQALICSRFQEMWWIAYKAEWRLCKNISFGLIKVLATNTTGLFNYQLFQFLEPHTENPIDGLVYRNNPLQNCSLQQIRFTQVIGSPLANQVTAS